MKFMSDIALSEFTKYQQDKMVDLIATHQGYIELPEPKLASEHSCEFCGSKQYFILREGEKMAWFCGRVCSLSMLPNSIQATITPPTPKRAIEWGLFCEINGIGDLDRNVKFEDIKQDPGRLQYLKKFGEKPSGLLIMQGPPGTGKTYAAMALCEFFTRKTTEALFMTYRQMIEKWLLGSKEEMNSFAYRTEMVKLLVIDDFGTAIPNSKFMEYFMGLINTRTRWSDRGTVITTNLPDKELSNICGMALADRLKTGQFFIFEGQSRRKKRVL